MDFPIVPFQYISSYTFTVSLQSFTLKAEVSILSWTFLLTCGLTCISTRDYLCLGS